MVTSKLNKSSDEKDKLIGFYKTKIEKLEQSVSSLKQMLEKSKMNFDKLFNHCKSKNKVIDELEANKKKEAKLKQVKEGEF